MSKNKQMHSREISVVGSEHETTGAASLTQGVYGERGNLELVACDAADGLWVFWFNADDPDDPDTTPDVLPGHWSSGLAFAVGTRYVDAQIVQSPLGPDHLEVLALMGDGVLESWYWSPGPGFQRRESVVAASVSRFGLTLAQGGVLSAAVEHRDGTTALLASDGSEYPERRWVAAEGPVELDDPAAAELLRAHGIHDAHEGTARAARSTRNGGTIELTWRDARGIRHLGIPA